MGNRENDEGRKYCGRGLIQNIRSGMRSLQVIYYSECLFSPGDLTVKYNAPIVHPDADLKDRFSQNDTDDFYRIHDAVFLKKEHSA